MSFVSSSSSDEVRAWTHVGPRFEAHTPRRHQIVFGGGGHISRNAFATPRNRILHRLMHGRGDALRHTSHMLLTCHDVGSLATRGVQGRHTLQDLWLRSDKVLRSRPTISIGLRLDTYRVDCHPSRCDACHKRAVDPIFFHAKTSLSRLSSRRPRQARRTGLREQTAGWPCRYQPRYLDRYVINRSTSRTPIVPSMCPLLNITGWYRILKIGPVSIFTCRTCRLRYLGGWLTTGSQIFADTVRQVSRDIP